jgi:hypothetical protein
MAEAAAAADLIEVTVRLVEGGSREFEVNPNQPVGALKQRAMAEFGIHPAPGVVYALFLNSGRLDDTMTLSAAGVVEGSVLILATEPQVGQTSFR